MYCKKCGHQSKENVTSCTECGGPIEASASADMASERPGAVSRKKLAIISVIAAVIVGGLFLLMNLGGPGGIPQDLDEQSFTYSQNRGAYAVADSIDLREGDIAVARIDGTYIWASELGYKLWLAEQNLIMEHMNMFPNDQTLDYGREFRNGLTFGEVVIREAAIHAAATLLFEAEAERLGVGLTDDDRSEIQRNIIEGWEGDLTPLHDVGITTSQQLTNVLEGIQVRDNVLLAMLDGLDRLQIFDKAVALGALTAAQHILIAFDSFDTEEQAFELAEALHERILAGEDFERLMLEYSDDQDPEMPPDTYTFTPGSMVPEFEQGARELEIGEVSVPIRSFFGYHIIRRAEPDPDPFSLFGNMDGALSDAFAEGFTNDAREKIEFLHIPSWDEINQILDDILANYEPEPVELPPLPPNDFLAANDDWIMVFGGERIPTTDFALMSVLTQQPINSLTKHGLLQELLVFLVLMEMGERYGVGFTQSELEENDGIASLTREMMEQNMRVSLDFVDDRRLGEFLGLFGHVGHRLIDLLVDFSPDEAEFRESLERHIEWLIEVDTGYDGIPPDLDLAEIESEFRENFIWLRSVEIFFEMLETWVSEADYELNHELFDAID